MISVTQASEKIINRSRYLSEALSKNLINISSLARYIKPEVEQLALKKVSEASIIMSLTRISKKIKPSSHYHSLFLKTPEITVRSPLNALLIDTSELVEIIKQLEIIQKPIFYKISVTPQSLLVLASEEIINQLIPYSHRKKNSVLRDVATISITLPESALNTPGAFYFFLKSLAWEHIPVLELFTQREEFTIVVEEKFADRAYGVIRTLFV